jgi:hypothetical protein
MLPVYPVLPGLTYTVLKTPGFDTLVQSAPNKYEVRIQQTTNPVWTYTLIYDFLHDSFWGPATFVSELRQLMGFFTQMGGKAKPFLLTDPDDNSVGPATLMTGWAATTFYPLGCGILDSAGHWQKITTPGTSGGTIPTFNHSGSTTSDGTAVWQDEGAGYGSSGIPNTFLAGLSLVNDGVGNYYSPIQRTLNGFFYEDITDLNGAIAVYNNATLATAGSGAGQYTVLGPGLALPTASYMGMYLKWNTGLSAWQATHSYATNTEILDPAGHIQKATTGGTSGATIPTFNDSAGTTTDGSVTWTDQGYNPGPTGNISAAFNFYFRVRFDKDEQDFEKWSGNNNTAGLPPSGQGGGLWTIGGSEAQNGAGTLILTTARPVSL